jgi:hypothetical protein
MSFARFWIIGITYHAMEYTAFVAPDVCFTSAESPEVLACSGYYIQEKLHLHTADIPPYMSESAIISFHSSPT